MISTTVITTAFHLSYDFHFYDQRLQSVQHAIRQLSTTKTATREGDMACTIFFIFGFSDADSTSLVDL